MTAVDHGAFTTLYVTNVLNGTVAAGTNPTTGLGNVVDGGTVVRANGGDGNIVETTPAGAQTDIAADGPGGAGVLFGLTVPPRFDGIYFVDDGDNTLRVLSP